MQQSGGYLVPNVRPGEYVEPVGGYVNDSIHDDSFVLDSSGYVQIEARSIPIATPGVYEAIPNISGELESTSDNSVSTLRSFNGSIVPIAPTIKRASDPWRRRFIILLILSLLTFFIMFGFMTFFIVLYQQNVYFNTDHNMKNKHDKEVTISSKNTTTESPIAPSGQIDNGVYFYISCVHCDYAQAYQECQQKSAEIANIQDKTTINKVRGLLYENVGTSKVEVEVWIKRIYNPDHENSHFTEHLSPALVLSGNNDMPRFLPSPHVTSIQGVLCEKWQN
ncbi:uncharacterized protein LOC120348297 [Styela clava]